VIRVRVQHHPSRSHLIPELLERLAPLPTEVVTHESDPPSPWGGYLSCMTDIPRCKHLLIVQDDVQIADNFVPALHDIARTKPDDPVCLFLAKLPRDVSHEAAKAMKYGQRYVRVNWRSFLPIVAILWPTVKLREFRDWALANPGLPGQRIPRSDDAMGGRWKMVNRQTVWATVPSIVEHPDIEPSTIGTRASAGRDRGRVAWLFARDAMRYDWTL